MAQAPDSATGSAEDLRPGSFRGAAGFFRVAQHVAGPWWLFDPSGRPIFLKAVNGVRAQPADTDIVPAHDPAVRLRSWSFNAVGTGGDGAARDDGFVYLACVDFCRAANLILAPGLRLPDVFDPDWPRHALARAEDVCAPLSSAREIVGWVTDDEIAWGRAASPTQPGVLQVCLSLEPGFASYHAAWEFVLALHGGRLETLARAWGVPLANKEVLREMTRAETGIVTRGYLRDEARWTREFARRYFSDTAAAIRANDPNHLVCGGRFRAPAGAAITGAVTYPIVDVALFHWAELPPAAAVTGPLLAGDVSWAEAGFWAAPATKGAAARLTSVERMLRRGRAALKRLARHPAVVGYVWAQWHDEPGEQPPFARGLVHVNGAEAREHTELLAEFNARAETLRRGAAKLLTS